MNMNFQIPSEDRVKLEDKIEFFMKEKEKKHHTEMEYVVRLQEKKK